MHACVYTTFLNLRRFRYTLFIHLFSDVAFGRYLSFIFDDKEADEVKILAASRVAAVARGLSGAK